MYERLITTKRALLSCCVQIWWHVGPWGQSHYPPFQIKVSETLKITNPCYNKRKGVYWVKDPTNTCYCDLLTMKTKVCVDEKTTSLDTHHRPFGNDQRPFTYS